MSRCWSSSPGWRKCADQLIPILVAIQSDPDLRRAIAPQLGLDAPGPHRAVSLVARHVAAARTSGKARAPDNDDVVALLLVGACFLRAWEHQASTHRPATFPDWRVLSPSC